MASVICSFSAKTPIISSRVKIITENASLLLILKFAEKAADPLAEDDQEE